MKVRMFNLNDSTILKIEKLFYNGGYPSELGYTISQILDQVNPGRPVHRVYMDDNDLSLIMDIIPDISEFEAPYEKGSFDVSIRTNEYAALMYALMAANAPQDILYELTESMAHYKGCLYGEYIIQLTPHFCRWFLDNMASVWAEYIEPDDKIFANLRIACMRGV